MLWSVGDIWMWNIEIFPKWLQTTQIPVWFPKTTTRLPSFCISATATSSTSSAIITVMVPAATSVSPSVSVPVTIPISVPVTITETHKNTKKWCSVRRCLWTSEAYADDASRLCYVKLRVMPSFKPFNTTLCTHSSPSSQYSSKYCGITRKHSLVFSAKQPKFGIISTFTKHISLVNPETVQRTQNINKYVQDWTCCNFRFLWVGHVIQGKELKQVEEEAMSWCMYVNDCIIQQILPNLVMKLFKMTETKLGHIKISHNGLRIHTSFYANDNWGSVTTSVATATINKANVWLFVSSLVCTSSDLCLYSSIITSL